MFKKIKKLGVIVAPSIHTYILTSILVLLAFLGVTLWSWNNAKNTTTKQLQATLDNGTASAADLINSTVSTYGEILRATAGIFYLDQPVTEDNWTRYVNNLQFKNRYPGLQGITFSQVVPAAQLEEFLANNKQANGQPYELRPSTPRDTYVISRFVVTEESDSSQYIGLDLFAEPSRRPTMEAARDTGQLAVTGNIQRIADKRPGLNLFVPIYKQDMPLNTVEERRAAHLGYLTSGIRLQDLLDGLFGKSITKDSAIQLFDGETDNPEHKVYQSPTYDNLVKDKGLFKSVKTFDLHGHKWTLAAVVNDSFGDQTRNRLPETILYGGITLSLMISALLFFIMVSRARAISSEKNKEVQEVKDNLISLASHQLRTPATGVKQFISMVIEGYAGEINDEQRVMLEKAYISNERQLDIINQILHVTRADSGRLVLSKKKTDINQLIKNILDEQKRSFEARKQRIYFKSSAKKIYLNVDPQYMSMAIDNLLSNANKYTYQNKRINIDVRRTRDSVVISVADRGVGIEPEDMHLLFQKFSRIQNELSVEAGGNGIGLYLCKEIIELHGGNITAESEPKKGTVFTVTLPRM